MSTETSSGSGVGEQQRPARQDFILNTKATFDRALDEIDARRTENRDQAMQLDNAATERAALRAERDELKAESAEWRLVAAVLQGRLLERVIVREPADEVALAAYRAVVDRRVRGSLY